MAPFYPSLLRLGANPRDVRKPSWVSPDSHIVPHSAFCSLLLVVLQEDLHWSSKLFSALADCLASGLFQGEVSCSLRVDVDDRRGQHSRKCCDITFVNLPSSLSALFRKSTKILFKTTLRYLLQAVFDRLETTSLPGGEDRVQALRNASLPGLESHHSGLRAATRIICFSVDHTGSGDDDAIDQALTGLVWRCLNQKDDNRHLALINYARSLDFKSPNVVLLDVPLEQYLSEAGIGYAS